MVRYFFLIFILTGQGALSQPFSFSQRSEYRSGTADYTNKKILFSNPLNDKYIGWFTPTLTGLKLIVTEFSKGHSHYFSICESQGQSGENAFKYEFSIDHKIFNKPPKLHHDFALVAKDSSTTTYQVTTYKNSSRKKLLRAITVNMANGAHNQFPLFRVACLHGSEDDYEFKGPFSGKVLSAQGTVRGKTWEAELLKMEQVSLRLHLQQNPRFVSISEWQKHMPTATR